MSFKRINKDQVFNSLKVTDPFQPTGGLIQPSSLEFTVPSSGNVIQQLDLSSSGRTIGVRMNGTSFLNFLFPVNAPSGYTVRFVVIEKTSSGSIGFQDITYISSITNAGVTLNLSGTLLNPLFFIGLNATVGDYIEFTKVGNTYAANGVAKNAGTIINNF